MGKWHTMNNNKEKEIEIYYELARSVITAFARLIGARLASSTFEAAALRQALQRSEGKHPAFGKSVWLDDLPNDILGSFTYITNISMLVYATTILDTFISQTTKFLIMRHPRSLTKESDVPFQDVLQAPSKAVLLTNTISRKIRNLSFRTFVDRITYLRKTFGLDVQLSSGSLETLEHFSGLRNVIVHDQGIFEIEFDDHMDIILKQKTCPLHPTPVSDKDVFRAWNGYRQVIKQIHFAVVSQILKCESDPRAQEIQGILEGDI